MILRPSLFAVSAVLALASTPVVAAPPAKAKPPAARPASGEPPVSYVVQRGDTLIGLGRDYLRKPGDYRRVQSANQISRPTAMPVGKTLVIDPNLLKTTPIDARLSAFSGPVEVETNGQRAPARAGMTIQEGQRIITGPGAFATFEMEDASRVTLPSNTTVRVDRLRTVNLTNAPQRVFRLDQGRSTIQATPNGNPNGRFEVRTPVSISAVRGTEFRVGAGGDKAQTEVIKGGVGVGLGESPPTGEPIPAGFGVTASPAGVSPPVALLPPPKLGDGGQTQGDKTVHFAVQPQDGAAAYRLQLSRDAGFVDIFAETTTQAPAADFGEIANGTYFIRLTALDGGGLEGFPGDYSFDRDLDTLDAGAPSDSREGKHRKFLFRWSSAGDGVRNYRFQLFANPSEKGENVKVPLVDQPGLTESQLTLTDLPPGSYAWRVAAVRFKNGAATEKVGPLQTLQIGK